ncbi:MAG: hypothetical protein OEV59_06235 [Deltaproteobacteria bacterium]|nr:hypothetical protein [Deltaproteobacteria bacterium]
MSDNFVDFEKLSEAEEAAASKPSRLEEMTKSIEGRIYDSFFVNEYGKIESVRAERYGMSFSVILLQVDSFASGARKAEGAELESFMKIVSDIVIKVIRNCDVAGKLDERRVLMVLPNTDYFGSLITLKKLTKALEPYTHKGDPHASVVVSQSTFPKDSVGYGELVNMATTRLHEIKTSFWEQKQLKTKLFWEVVALLTSGSLSGYDFQTFDAGGNSDFNMDYIGRINDAIIKEIIRNPDRRGVLYIGAKNISADLPILKTIKNMGRSSTKVFLVGEHVDKNADIRNAIAITINDPRVTEMLFTFFLTEHAAYALICKESWGETYNCFHTANPYIVEGLITKFQRDMYLQEQL